MSEHEQAKQEPGQAQGPAVERAETELSDEQLGQAAGGGFGSFDTKVVNHEEQY